MPPLTVLRTSRLALRPHHEGDVAGLTKFVTYPACTRHMLIPKERQSAEDAREMIELMMQSYSADPPLFALALADPSSDALLGFCHTYPFVEPQTLELVYAVSPQHQGRDLATEAAAAVIHYVLSDSTVQRIVAFAVSDNLPSIRVAEKLGFQNAGPAMHPHDPERRTTIRFEITKRHFATNPNEADCIA